MLVILAAVLSLSTTPLGCNSTVYLDYSGSINMTTTPYTYYCFVAKAQGAAFAFHRFGSASIYILGSNTYNGTAYYATTVSSGNVMNAVSFGYNYYGVIEVVSTVTSWVSFTFHTYPTMCDTYDITNYPTAYYNLPDTGSQVESGTMYCAFFAIEGNQTINATSSGLSLSDTFREVIGYSSSALAMNGVSTVQVSADSPIIFEMSTSYNDFNPVFYLAAYNTSIVPDYRVEGEFESLSDISYLCPNGSSGTLSLQVPIDIPVGGIYGIVISCLFVSSLISMIYACSSESNFDPFSSYSLSTRKEIQCQVIPRPPNVVKIPPPPRTVVETTTVTTGANYSVYDPSYHRTYISHPPVHHTPVYHAPAYHAPAYHAPVHHSSPHFGGGGGGGHHGGGFHH